jgi:uncharacterized protein (DUF4415 family)
MLEWDEAKRQKNLEKHSLDIRDARLIFDGRKVVSVAIIGEKFYTVIWTWRADRHRIIFSGDHAMARKEHIVKYKDEELTKLVKQEGTLTDWGKAASMTKAEIEERIASDSDEDGMVMDWDNATVELPEPKAVLNMRIDKDVLEYFRKTGKGYQSRINAILRSYVERREHHQKG